VKPLFLRKAVAQLARFYFRRFRSRAAKLVLNPLKMKKVLDTAEQNQSFFMGPLERLRKDVLLLTGLTGDWMHGHYKAVPVKSIVGVVGAILYFISPLDAIPDFIPVIGFLDDAFIIGLAIKQIRVDLDRYELWKAAQALGHGKT
jgi:uncharacterized membrane protein YkvA (DUF1232 family)